MSDEADRPESTIKTYSKHFAEPDAVPMVVAEDIREYREMISHFLKPNDIVIEIGCAEGVTTDLMRDHCADAVGIDLSETQIKRARERFPRIQFEIVDARDISAIRALRPRFNVLFVDISGNRELQTVIPLLKSYEIALKPQLIIVKNFKLQRLLNQCHIYENYPKVQQLLAERFPDRR